MNEYEWCPYCRGDALWGHLAYCKTMRDQRRKVLRAGLVLLVVIALLSILALWPTKAEAGNCYRPFIYSKPTYSYNSYYYPYYVPQVIEVQVIKDRYYSLSDLYRDRLYLEQYDLMKEMRARLNQIAPTDQQPYIPPTQGNPNTAPAPVPQPQAKASPKDSTGITTKAEAILVKNCQTCHLDGKAQTKLNMANLTTLTSVQRWAIFGMAAAGDMPPPPDDLKVTGKEKELNEWKKLHALSEQDMGILYPWAQQLQAKK